MAKSRSAAPRRKQTRKAKQPRVKKATGGPALAAPEEIPSPSEDVNLTVTIDDGSALEPRVDPVTGAIEVPHEDGSILVDFSGENDPEIPDGQDHDANLAEILDEYQLDTIAEDLLEGIHQDNESRAEWLEMRSRGIDMLGLKVEQSKSGVGASTAPLEGMSVVRDPVMLEAVLRFQANAQGEMLPANGPVKVVNYASADTTNDRLAEALEKDLNYYLTSIATEYYPDSRRMYFWTGFSGLAFKKVYRCPLRRRPVSESVDATDLIVSDTITDLRNAQRITHQITMRKSTMKRMQILGAYRKVDVDLMQAQPSDNPVKNKVDQVQGIQPSERPQDLPYNVYECYCELDLPGFEHKENGEPTGLPLPYRVAIERDSRKILEIRRNWKEDDADYLAKIPFVAFPYATGLGFYGIGLLHILGNLTNALTALTREAIDAGMFANFPGFLVAKSAQRQQTNEFRIPPGGGLPIETNGNPIGQMVMPLPYKEFGPATMQLMESLRSQAQRVGGTADTPVGEGRQDAPVGTTLALIEQATKVEGAVHKALHAAQAEEFKLLCELFKEDPEALWRGNRRSAMTAQGVDRVALFKTALENCEIVPKADPNVPSHMTRIMRANGLLQLAAADPILYDKRKVNERALAMMQIDQPADLFNPPQDGGPPPPDPLKMAEVQVKAKQVEVQAAKVSMDAANKAKDREARQNIEVLKLASSLAVHPESDPIVDTQLMQLAPLMGNIRPGLPQGLGGLPPARFMPPPRSFPPPMQGFPR